MKRIIAAALAALLMSGAAAAQTAPTPEQTASLTWMQGVRVHTNANGTKVLEAFLGPVNGVVTGTALAMRGDNAAFTEYHKIGPNADGVYGLDVANTTNGMKWNFTPLKSIEPGKITFQSANGAVTISYAATPDGGIDAQVVRAAAGAAETKQEWNFKLEK
jgi:opacity protein-like surface antigen